jgi:hypothetical protein
VTIFEMAWTRYCREQVREKAEGSPSPVAMPDITVTIFESWRGGSHEARYSCRQPFLKGGQAVKRYSMNADTERIEWLEKQQGSALVSDDRKHWAVVTSGFQNVPMKTPADIQTTFFIEKKDWKKSIRKAIDAAMKREAKIP